MRTRVLLSSALPVFACVLHEVFAIVMDRLFVASKATCTLSDVFDNTQGLSPHP